MRYLVAVSGGVDSVVLLDQLVKAGEHELIVAHFDHGIRDDSAADARFVEALAAYYHLPFVSAREELGKQASEELARDRRYAFLREMAQKHQATIMAAHHADDVIETIAINLIRGTGWRGVAVMRSSDVARPLLHMTKQQIRDYAIEHRLEWVEDSTNSSSDYLRNRVRQKIAAQMIDKEKQAVLAIWRKQLDLRVSIERELRSYVQLGEYSRYFITLIEDKVAVELLRALVIAAANRGPTRPQLERALLAIKTARPHTSYEIGDGVTLRFTARTFIVETP